MTQRSGPSRPDQPDENRLKRIKRGVVLVVDNGESLRSAARKVRIPLTTLARHVDARRGQAGKERRMTVTNQAALSDDRTMAELIEENEQLRTQVERLEFDLMSLRDALIVMARDWPDD